MNEQPDPSAGALWVDTDGGQGAIDGACQNLVDRFAPLLLALSGHYDKDSRILTIQAQASPEPDVKERLLDVFYEIPYVLPLKRGEGASFRFEADVEGRSIVVQTSVDFMPDTGGLTRAQWQAYVNQLTYTENGVPQTMQPPEDFLDDPQ
jgi:hypothetical protein